MESIWFKPDLADEIIKSESIFDQTKSIVTDIISQRIDITDIVENMAGVLTNMEPEARQRGMKFFTKLMKEIPKNYLTSIQLKFISKFYIDRLKDNHRVIPSVLEGYLALIKMNNFDIHSCGEYFTTLFREVACQSQVRQDRLHIYLTLQTLLERDAEYMKTLGPDFLYGVISAMDGERDPRNLLFLFSFIPKFLSHVSLGHLVEEMFEVISCYYPIDFHPSPNDPAPVTRDELAAALCPCLCAVPDFGEHCMILLVEKLDSTLRVAKLDSLKLLTESCKTFNPDSYGPFLKTLWSSIHREITHKTDDELRMAAHGALSALVAKLATTANTDQAFENFVKGIIIASQTSLVDSKTVHQFVQASKVLLTVANSSKISCAMITRSMIPSIIGYYEFKNTSKLQTASLDFLGDLYELALHWDILNEVGGLVNEIPNLCLVAASEPSKDYQVAGLKTLIRIKDALNVDMVVPFVEILTYNIQHSSDDDVLKYSVDAIHAIAKKYPETIMNLVVKGKCDLDNLTEDKATLQNRLNLLSSLASFDDFTEMIIGEVLKLITMTDEAPTALKALNGSLSDTSLYTEDKLVQIESDHGLIDSVLTWLLKDTNAPEDSVSHGYELISNTISSLPSEKQLQILQRHTDALLERLKTDENYYPILHCMYNSVQQDLWSDNFENLMKLSLERSLNSNNSFIRIKACHLIAHLLNKSEFGLKFELLYELLKSYLSGCSKDDDGLCRRLIFLYGFITKALVMRGSEHFKFWLQKITIGLTNPDCCGFAAEAMHTIMTDSPSYLNARQHCRSSLLYKQRVFHAYTNLMHACTCDKTKESYYLSWAYVIGGTPKSVINTEINKIAPLVVEALDYDNKDLLLVMMDVLLHFVQAKQVTVAQSLQTILPRLIKLTTYVKSMDVRIKSLECLYEVANSYPTVLLVPYKRDVLLQLARSLDDKKRLVRSVSVRARTRWFLVGSPGEPKDD